MPSTLTVEEFIDHLAQHRATAILRTSHADAVEPAMAAAVEAGFRTVEFTLTTPSALEDIKLFATGRYGDVIVGAGTVLTRDDARAAVDAGAQFLVSPVVDESVISTANELGVAMIPGTSTPTEMLRAHQAGAPLQKVFPALAGGPRDIKAILGPLPFLRLVPTNGVHENNAEAYLKAGAHAVGFVNNLFDPNGIAQRDFGRIRNRACKLLAAIGNKQAEDSSNRTTEPMTS